MQDRPKIHDLTKIERIERRNGRIVDLVIAGYPGAALWEGSIEELNKLIAKAAIKKKKPKKKSREK